MWYHITLSHGMHVVKKDIIIELLFGFKEVFLKVDWLIAHQTQGLELYGSWFTQVQSKKRALIKSRQKVGNEYFKK